MPSLSLCALSPLHVRIYWFGIFKKKFSKFIYALIFVFQFVTLVDTPRPAR